MYKEDGWGFRTTAKELGIGWGNIGLGLSALPRVAGAVSANLSPVRPGILDRTDKELDSRFQGMLKNPPDQGAILWAYLLWTLPDWNSLSR